MRWDGSLITVGLGLAGLLAGPGRLTAATGAETHPSTAVSPASPERSEIRRTEPEPVSELVLSDIFRRPVGPRGLEYSGRALELEGRRVRLRGYVVRQTAPIPFGVLLAPLPVSLHEREYGLAEDLPASTVHVFFQRSPLPVMPRIRGLVTVEGVLELGPREEADGRISHVRLRVPAPLTSLLATQDGTGMFGSGVGSSPPTSAAVDSEGRRGALPSGVTVPRPTPSRPVDRQNFNSNTHPSS